MEITRKKRSMKIKHPQMTKLAKWVNEQDSLLDAALFIGVDRSTLSRILKTKTASSDTVELIFSKIEA